MQCTPYTVPAIDGDGNEVDFPAPPPALQCVDLVAASGAFPFTLIEGSSGEFTRIYRLSITSDADTVITMMDGATNLPFTISLVAGETVLLDPGVFPYWQGTNGKDFKINSSTGAANLTGAVWGFQNAS